jgi:hypothetical protein
MKDPITSGVQDVLAKRAMLLEEYSDNKKKVLEKLKNLIRLRRELGDSDAPGIELFESQLRAFQDNPLNPKFSSPDNIISVNLLSSQGKFGLNRDYAMLFASLREDMIRYHNRYREYFKLLIQN